MPTKDYTEHDFTRFDAVIRLLQKQSAGEVLSAEETGQLQAWQNQNSGNEVFVNSLEDAAAMKLILAEWHRLQSRQVMSWNMVAQRITNNQSFVRPVHRVHFLRTAWFRWAAAIIIVFGIGTYIFTSQQRREVVFNQPSPKSNDIMPGSDKAILTLSGGQRIEISNATSETITDGNLSIENNNGQLFYKNAQVDAINTMSTPKGGQYKLTLADGTKVWLNAASSITYPAAFTGNTREVSVNGEAYFEVGRSKEKPFTVKTASGNIIVLGTEFNVNTYEDEKSKISLVNGAIKINDKLLTPGQALSDGNIQSTNIGQDIAWKNGAFNFQDMDLVAALRQLARWYDVDIRYEGKVPVKKLRGELGRDLNLSQVLKAFKAIGVNTRLEGKVLTVLSQ